MPRFYLALAAGIMAAPAAQAQQVECANAQVQLEMTYCAKRDWQIADADLNAAYQAAQGSMKAVDLDLAENEQGASRNLRDAQRAWVTFRDAACAAEGYPSHGGSIEPMIIFYCRARLTEDRAADLWTLSGQEQ